MATIPDPRVAQLCEIYKPKKITQASLEIVDTPGLSRTHEGSAQKLAAIREAGALVMVFALAVAWMRDGAAPPPATGTSRNALPTDRWPQLSIRRRGIESNVSGRDAYPL